MVLNRGQRRVISIFVSLILSIALSLSSYELLEISYLLSISAGLVWFPTLVHVSEGWQFGKEQLSWEIPIVSTSVAALIIGLPINGAYNILLIVHIVGIIVLLCLEPK